MSDDAITGRSMRGFRRVLVAFGGATATARDAGLIRCAAGVLAEGGELVLLCAAVALNGQDPLPAGIAGAQRLMDDLAQERLEAAAIHVPEGVAHEVRLGWEPLAEAALEVLDEADCDVVVVGHRGRGELSIVLHGGSVAHRLLHHCRVPVLVVPQGPDR
jgi:nucleotide-binding universal stress UspA family protein